MRLTPTQVMDRELSEDEFRQQVNDLAEILGWRWMHVDPLRTSHGWRTATHGPLGKGWPDTVFVHPRGGVLFVEFKRETGKTTADQDEVIEALRAAGQSAFVWRPSDLPAIQRILEERS